jgi:hypothetical protein
MTSPLWPRFVQLSFDHYQGFKLRRCRVTYKLFGLDISQTEWLTRFKFEMRMDLLCRQKPLLHELNKLLAEVRIMAPEWTGNALKSLLKNENHLDYGRIMKH